MNDKERNEHKRLLHLWATGKATHKQLERCMELDRKASAELAAEVARIAAAGTDVDSPSWASRAARESLARYRAAT